MAKLVKGLDVGTMNLVGALMDDAGVPWYRFLSSWVKYPPVFDGASRAYTLPLSYGLA